MSSEEEFVVSEEEEAGHSSDYEDDKRKKKSRRSLSGAKLGNKKPNTARAKQGKQAVHHEDYQVVKRTRRSNDNLSDDEIRAQVLQCFAEHAEWTKKNLRLTLGIQLWKFQKFLDEMCDLDADEGKYYTLKQALLQEQPAAAHDQE